MHSRSVRSSFFVIRAMSPSSWSGVKSYKPNSVLTIGELLPCLWLFKKYVKQKTDKWWGRQSLVREPAMFGSLLPNLLLPSASYLAEGPTRWQNSSTVERRVRGGPDDFGWIMGRRVYGQR